MSCALAIAQENALSSKTLSSMQQHVVSLYSCANIDLKCLRWQLTNHFYFLITWEENERKVQHAYDEGGEYSPSPLATDGVGGEST